MTSTMEISVTLSELLVDNSNVEKQKWLISNLMMKRNLISKMMRTNRSGMIYKLIRKMMKLKFNTNPVMMMTVRMLKGGLTRTMIINVIVSKCSVAYVMCQLEMGLLHITDSDVQFTYLVIMILFMLSCLVLLIYINMLILLTSLCQ